MMASSEVYTPGDRHRASREMARMHRPLCMVEQGECGCSTELVPQPWRYFINDAEVSEAEYGAAQDGYRTFMEPWNAREARLLASLREEREQSLFAEGLTESQVRAELVKAATETLHKEMIAAYGRVV